MYQISLFTWMSYKIPSYVRCGAVWANINFTVFVLQLPDFLKQQNYGNCHFCIRV